MIRYSAGIYAGSEGRQRWAVFCEPSMTWIFPKRHGRQAAEQLARRLNRKEGNA